jgi:protein gp37
VSKTGIPYADEGWAIVTGCTKVSPGCLNCYACRLAATRLKNRPAYKRLAEKTAAGYDWTAPPRFHADQLDAPLHWRKPRRVFVSPMSDLFHEAFTADAPSYRTPDAVFSTMEQCPQHTFLVLTKRPGQMAEYVHSRDTQQARDLGVWPLPNVHLGVTVCNQEEADRNIPILLDTPAAVRWISFEPLLGPVDSRPYFGVDWVVLGPETGPRKRPFGPQWAADIREQCLAAGVPYFDKRESHRDWRELPVTS